jgi:transposase
MKHRKFRLSADAIRAFEERERETREALELRHLQAVRMYGSGMDIGVIEQVSGAARRTIADWIKAYQVKGLEGLKPGWKGGNHHTLTVKQRADCTQRLRQMTPAQVLKVRTYFPPACPHLNPQEHVWKAARQKVSHNHRFPTMAALRQAFATFLDSTCFQFRWVEKFAPPSLCGV